MPEKNKTDLPAEAASLLAGINSPEDLRRVNRADLPRLAEEIRAEIIRVVRCNGGHLASSLGAVELIIALHYALNTPQDKIVFDVGHQSYAHKIITGRKDKFHTLRREGGLSGFPKRNESEYDVFDTGHSSTSVSAALGLACARDLAGADHNVVAILGDGAFTGGMALEAMNHAGALKKKLIVVLNDNNMSISPNVGGLSEYMSLMATSPAYVNLRKKVKNAFAQYMPERGPHLISTINRIEEALKSVVTSPSTIFEALGFRYLGPFDGHDVNLLIEGLSGSAGLDRPVLMHVITTKGKGYQPAEDDPCGFHGVGRVETEEKKPVPETSPPPHAEAEAADLVEVSEIDDQSQKSPVDRLQIAAKSKSYSEVFGEALSLEAESDSRVAAITAAMSEGTGLSEFFKKFPDRAFDVGIAEQHAVTLAAGLSAGGFRPVAAIYSSFLQRAFDQLFHDVALQNLPVVLAVDRAGLVGEDGPTHHGGLDLSYLRLLPGFTVMAPADADELRLMLKLALSLNGPSAIRYPRGKAPESLTPSATKARGLSSSFPAETFKPPLNCGGVSPLRGMETGRGLVLKEGGDLSLLAIGPQVGEALAAAERLAAEGISAAVINMRFIKPLDIDLILDQADKTGRILTLEENSLAGGLFGAVSEALAGRKINLRGLGLTDAQVQQASQKAQRAALNLDADGIYRAALAMMK